MSDKQEHLETLNIDEPRYSQKTYIGRAKHFIKVTNPLNVLASDAELTNAKRIVTDFRNNQLKDISVDELWRAKYLHDSAFHPDTGEKQIIIGRMAAQVPMNMMITGGMMSFYRSNKAVIFWQWLNQTFNALVNYTNRSGDAAISTGQLLTSYLCATTGAVTTAMTLNRYAKRLPPIAGRFVPFFAVVAANSINIPMMRMGEITNGTPVFNAENKRMGLSSKAARTGISQVYVSRLAMAAPSMLVTPFIMQHFERRGMFINRTWLNVPVQIGVIGILLIIGTPLGCAIFKQTAEINFNQLETSLQEEIRGNEGSYVPETLYYNKGL